MFRKGWVETEELAKTRRERGEQIMEIRVALGPPPVYLLHFGCQGLGPSILEGGRKQHWRGLLLPRRCAVLSRLLKPSPGLSLQGPEAQNGGSACEENWVRVALLQPTGPAYSDSAGAMVGTCSQFPSVQHPPDGCHIAPMICHVPLLG